MRAMGTADLLSGLGFARISHRHRTLLSRIFLFSAAVHIVALAVLGGWTVLRTPKSESTLFLPVPPAKHYDPRQLELNVKMTKRQRSSARPQPTMRLTAFRDLSVALPSMPLRAATTLNTFLPHPSIFSGNAFAAGFGDGNALYGFGEGASSFDFVGIPVQGDKVAILVDVSVSMVEEDRGGVTGYERVKRRIGEVVDSLGELSLFNLIVFADAARTMSDQMLIASPENKTRAKLFLRPYNTEGNWGLAEGNVQSGSVGLTGHGGTTRLDLALTAACKNGADTILILSDGIPRVHKAWPTEQLSAFRARQATWYTEHAAEVASWDAAQKAAPTSRVWIPPTPARKASATPPREGQPVDRGRPAQPGRWVVRSVGGNRGARPAPPPIPEPGCWTLADFVEHLRLLCEHDYADRGQKPPTVHCIGYQIDREGGAFLEGLAKSHHGKYRRVTRIASSR